ncbi:MAG: tetratricopeptide repeat protein, partial [Leptospiraceae bacterium]|nr:tetratricopeptide repeat protein [Leptospiraceae bacterium]
LLREFGQGEKEVAYRLNLARAHVGAGKYEAALQALAGVEKKADDPSAAEALFLRAEIAYQQGKFPEALQFYARFTRKYRNHPRRAEAELGIGWTYFELKQFARAADQFRTLIQTAPAPWRSKALLALGACQYNLRDFSGAEQSYRQVLAEHADQPTDYAEALYQLGWLFFRRNQPKEARDHFRRYLAGGHAQPRRHEAAYFSAFCLFQTNDFAGAENEFLVLLRNEDLPQWLKEKALADLARSRSSQKKYSAARADWQKLLQDSAQSPLAEEAHYQIATLSLQLGEEEAALSAMAQLREKNPSSTWLKEGLAELFVYFRNKKDFARATAILQELGKLRQNPEEKAELRLKKSELLIAEGKTSEAEAILNAVLADPDVADGHKLHALAMLTALWENSGRFAEAVAKIEKLAERFPKEEFIAVELQFAAGRFLFLAGQHAEAAQKLTGLARRREIADRSRFLLGEIALAQKKTALAIDYFRQVSQKTDQALWLKARLRIGEILYTQKDFEEAAREFSRISYAETREDAVYEKSLYYAMLCFKALGKSREAEVFHNRLKEAFPHSPFLKETD